MRPTKGGCFAAFVSAITRQYGIKGLFYKVCGRDVAGMTVFTESEFDIYKDLALVNPSDGDDLCNALRKNGVPTVLMDANDFDRNEIGRAKVFH